MNRSWSSQPLKSFPPSLSDAYHEATLTSSQPPLASSSPLQTYTSISTGPTVFITVTRYSTSSFSPTSSLPTLHEPSRAKSTAVGIVAGGTVGGITLVASTIFLFLLFRRIRRSKEEREATLPPYPGGGDMSEQLSGTTTAANAETKIVTMEIVEKNSVLVPQLDSTMISPITEAHVDPLGNIPELPATTRNADPFAMPDPSAESEAPESPVSDSSEVRSFQDPENYIIGLAQLYSMGNRDPSSRLSQPHLAPDTSVAVWGNMSSNKPGRE